MELLAILITILFSATLLSLWRWRSTYQNLPPGPPGWPVVGNLFQVILQKRHFIFLIGDLRKKYGPIFTLKMGQRTLVIISSSELIHEALVEKGAAFASRPAESPLRLIFSKGKCTINSGEYGPLWRTLRRNLVTEMINPTRIKQCSWIRNWAIENHMKRLQDEAEQVSGVRYVEVLSNCRLTVCSILICLCFGVKVTEERIKVIDNLLKDVLLITFPQLSDFLPFLAPLFRSQMRAAKELRKKQLEYMVPLIRNRKEFYDSSGKGSSSAEMASPLGAAYIDSLFELEVPNRILGEEEMITLCSEAIIGGTDTSSTAVEWAMFHLVQNQEMQEKLYREIVDTVGVNGVVTEENVEKMPYLGAIVKETFRRHPPTHFLISHAATQETELGGYKIPPGVYVEFYTAWLTQDPEMWENPSEFRPERFLSGDGVDTDITGVRGVKMLPFGAGRRICPAWSLGTLHINLLLAKMVQAYKWMPCPNNMPDPTEKFAATVVMKNPLTAIIVPRETRM